MLGDLKGKVALVTGAGSGIGRAVAEALAGAGAKPVACDINTDTLAALSAALNDSGLPHIAVPLDVCDRAQWSEAVARAERELGTVQILCNIAGVTAPPTKLLDLSGEAWDWIVRTNLTGAFNGVKAVAGRLRALGLPGHIVNTASTQGLYAAPKFAAYNAAKFGVVGFSETLKMDLADDNISVSVLCPGLVHTNILTNSNKIAPHLAPMPGGGPRTRSELTYPRPAAEVAGKVVDAIRHDRFYVFTHNEFGSILETRWKALSSSIEPGADPDTSAGVRRSEATAVGLYEAIERAERSRWKRS